MLYYECGDDDTSPDRQVWCILLYRNFTLAVARSGLTLYTVDRDTVLGMLLKQEYQVFNATIYESQNFTIQLTCDNLERYTLYCVVGFLYPETGQFAASAVFLVHSLRVWEVASSRLQGPPATLGGVLYVLDGEVLTEHLWSRMAEYRAGDERVRGYIDWLRAAIAGAAPGYSAVFDNYEWARRGVTPPDYDSVVRIGRVELPFGVGLIVTAYTAGSGATVVVHATITDTEEWLELLARLHPHPPSPYTVNVTQEWALWTIRLPSGATYIVQEDGTVVPVNGVAVLLEMPAYTLYYQTYLFGRQVVLGQYQLLEEYVYWTLVHPAFAIAVRIASPSHENLWELYTRYGTEFTRGVVLLDVRHPGDVACEVEPGCGYTPYMIRLMGWGVCWEQSHATMVFASNALGAHTAYIEMRELYHAISVLANATNPTIDYDRNGIPESEIIIDTARLNSPSLINSNIDVAIEFPPLLAFPVYSPVFDLELHASNIKHEFRYFYYLSGVVDAMLSLPPWLRAPWTDALLEPSRFHQELAKSIAIAESLLRLPPWSIINWDYWLEERGIAKDTMTLEDAIHYSLQAYKEYAEKHGWTPPPSHRAVAGVAHHAPQLHKTPTPPPKEPGKG